MTQKWQYKFIEGERKPISEFDNERGFDKVHTYEKGLVWTVDGMPTDPAENIISLVGKLGEQGWELISILPRSNAVSMATMGVTTEELWVFKKPA